jgi:hypothetical protein
MSADEESGQYGVNRGKPESVNKEHMDRYTFNLYQKKKKEKKRIMPFYFFS